jgi:hypothetical protein
LSRAIERTSEIRLSICADTVLDFTSLFIDKHPVHDRSLKVIPFKTGGNRRDASSPRTALGIDASQRYDTIELGRGSQVPPQSTAIATETHRLGYAWNPCHLDGRRLSRWSLTRQVSPRGSTVATEILRLQRALQPMYLDGTLRSNRLELRRHHLGELRLPRRWHITLL